MSWGWGGGGGSCLPCSSASYGLEIMLLTFTNIGSVNYRKGKVIFDKHRTVKRDKTYFFIFYFFFCFDFFDCNIFSEDFLSSSFYLS